MSKYDYDYYSGDDSEQFRYLKIPKVFFEDPAYWELGMAECVLYGFLHEQVALSKKNGWVDEAGKIYIIRTLESVQKLLHDCSADKARSTLKNLVEFGLIEKKRRGQGKPDIIYVKNFVKKSEKKSENATSEKTGDCGKLFSETGKIEVTRKEEPQSRDVNPLALEAAKSSPNETIYNDIYTNEPVSIHPSNLHYTHNPHTNDVMTDKDRMACASLIKDNIDYDNLRTSLASPSDQRILDTFYELMFDVVTGSKRKYRINDQVYSKDIVTSRFLKLGSNDICVCIEKYKSVTIKIHNVRSYMIAMLYNASLTQDARITNNTNVTNNKSLYSKNADSGYEGLTNDELEKLLGVT